jgi:putative FmdB family regulatory protein
MSIVSSSSEFVSSDKYRRIHWYPRRPRSVARGFREVIIFGHGIGTPAEGDIIPIYEYSCQACGNHFELLVRKAEQGVCPKCESVKIERLISSPTVQSSGTRDLAMRSAKKRDKAQGQERMHAQLQYEQSHDRHGHD